MEMMMTLQRDDASVSSVPATWTSPEPDLWIASSAGEFAGMVEFRDGHFVAGDRTGNQLGNFSSIPAAREAVDASISASAAPVSTLASRLSRPTDSARALRHRQGGDAV